MKKPSEIITKFAEEEYKKANGEAIGFGQVPTNAQFLDGVIRYLDLPWYKKLQYRLGL